MRVELCMYCEEELEHSAHFYFGCNCEAHGFGVQHSLNCDLNEVTVIAYDRLINPNLDWVRDEED